MAQAFVPLGMGSPSHSIKDPSSLLFDMGYGRVLSGAVSWVTRRLFLHHLRDLDK